MSKPWKCEGCGWVNIGYGRECDGCGENKTTATLSRADVIAEIQRLRGGALAVHQVDPVHNPGCVMGPGDEVPRSATAEERAALGLPEQAL